jgi:hypothetical protein
LLDAGVPSLQVFDAAADEAYGDADECDDGDDDDDFGG